MCLPHHRGGDEISSRDVFSPLTINVPGRQQASLPAKEESNQVRSLTELSRKAPVTMWDTQNLEETLRDKHCTVCPTLCPRLKPGHACFLGCLTMGSGGFQFLKTGVRVLRT